MRRIITILFVMILICNCSFGQDESYAGISYSVIPASHPVFNSDEEFEKTSIGSEEFGFYAHYGDTIGKKSFWFTSFNFNSIKSNNNFNETSLNNLKDETPKVFSNLPSEKFYSLSLGFQYRFNEKYSLDYLNSLMLTDVSVEGKHINSYNLDGIICGNRLFKKENTIGFGAYLNTNFKKVTFFPVLNARYQVKKWEFYSALPLEFSADYNLSKSLSIGASSNLNIYNFDLPEQNNNVKSYITHTIFKLGANIEYKFPYVAIFSGIGLAYQEYEYNSNGNIRFTLPESSYLEVGIRLIDN